MEAPKETNVRNDASAVQPDERISSPRLERPISPEDGLKEGVRNGKHLSPQDGRDLEDSESPKTKKHKSEASTPGSADAADTNKGMPSPADPMTLLAQMSHQRPAVNAEARRRLIADMLEEATNTALDLDDERLFPAISRSSSEERPRSRRLPRPQRRNSVVIHRSGSPGRGLLANPLVDLLDPSKSADERVPSTRDFSSPLSSSRGPLGLPGNESMLVLRHLNFPSEQRSARSSPPPPPGRIEPSLPAPPRD